MSTTVVEFENQDVIVVEMSGRGPIGPRGRQGEPGPAGPSEWGVIQGNISDQTDLQNALDSKANVGVSYTKAEDDALLAQKADADSVYTKTETDSLLADKADADSVYTKTEVNTLLSGKADADTVYTKTETDTLLDAKADVGDSYTKTEEDTLLAVKANSADVYTKTETDTLLGDKADADTVYTKTETDSLLADKADADDVYTKDDVDDALAEKANTDDVYTKDETDEMLLSKAPVILNSASGSIASFSDGSPAPVTALSVGIEPVQDLHGYDNPWPAGGGKNLCPPTGFTHTGVTTDEGYVTTYQTRLFSPMIPVTAGSTYTAKIVGESSTSEPLTFNRWIGYDSSKTFAQRISLGTTTLQTVTATIPSGISYIVLDIRTSALTTELNESDIQTIQVELGSTATSYVPYSNICPISGHDTATVTRTGKNLFDGQTYTLEQGTLSSSGAGASSTDFCRLKDFWAIPRIGTYAISSSVEYIRVYFYDSNKTFLSRTSSWVHSFETPEGTAFIKAIFGKSTGGTATAPSDVTNIQLELGSTASAYEPYQGQQVTIDLDGTRYGGTLDVLTGKMAVDRAIVDLGTLTWDKQTFANQKINFRCTVDGQKLVPDSAVANVICDSLQTVTASKMMNDLSCEYGISARGSTISGLRVCYFSYNTLTASEFKTAMSGIQATYELATPFTVQLTPNQLSTLLGTNHLWADTGDTAVEYRADTKLYIDSKFAQLQALILEN